MAGVGAPPGNQNASKRSKTKHWRMALELALQEAYPTATPTPAQEGEALLAIARRTVLDAINGDAKAREEIANRLDGRVPQPVGGDDESEPIRTITEVLWNVVDATRDRHPEEGGGYATPAGPV